jgi:hypothetical protein
MATLALGMGVNTVFSIGAAALFSRAPAMSTNPFGRWNGHRGFGIVASR